MSCVIYYNVRAKRNNLLRKQASFMLLQFPGVPNIELQTFKI